MTFEDLIKNCSKTSDEMKTHGFPERITHAFLLTADQVQSVVMSRVPGKPTTTFIDEGYDLKSMYIKAKSCDWGPMAGFVCELPPFNKKGAGGIQFNEKKIAEYIEKLSNGEIVNPTVTDKKSPYVQIKISDARKNEIFENNENVKDLNIENIEKGDGEIKGYACDKKENPTVLMQFLMKKEGELWALYHGEIYTNMSSNGFNKYEQKGLDTCGISAVWSENSFHSKDFSKTPKIYPIRGLMNPYLPYYDENKKEDTENYYKNAVAGDYDLFAVWPVVPPCPRDDLVRLSELKQKDKAPEQSPSEYYLFLRVPDKKYSIEFNLSRNVFIEFIPGRKEMKELEDPSIGNINNSIFLVAQTLNSFVEVVYKGQVPNRAFHSDEGGRLEVNEIEYPIAVFLPPTISSYIELFLKDVEKKGPRNMLIESHDQFVTLINIMRGRCYILLNFVWLINLFILFYKDLEKTKNGEFSKQQEWVNKMISQQKELKQSDELKKQLIAILSGSEKNFSRDVWSEAFDRIVNIFVKIAQDDFKDKPSEEKIKLFAPSLDKS
jgi:hypothetical protein